MIELRDAIANAKDFATLDNLFANEVDVRISFLTGREEIVVVGYQGSVSSDYIAEQVFVKSSIYTKDAHVEILKENLLNKVFASVETRVRQSERVCGMTLIYKVRHISRTLWSSSTELALNTPYWLRHRAVIDCLTEIV